MTKKEMLKRTKEFYSSVIEVFKNKETVKMAMFDNLFEEDHVKVMVLLIEYFKLKKIPKPILELCVTCDDIDKELYESFYECCQDQWLKKANAEIKSAIKEIENMKD